MILALVMEVRFWSSFGSPAGLLMPRIVQLFLIRVAWFSIQVKNDLPSDLEICRLGLGLDPL